LVSQRTGNDLLILRHLPGPRGPGGHPMFLGRWPGLPRHTRPPRLHTHSPAALSASSDDEGSSRTEAGSTLRSLRSGLSRLKRSSSECREPSRAVNTKPADHVPPCSSQDSKDKKRISNFQNREQDDGKREIDEEDEEPSPAAVRGEQPDLS